MIVRLSKNILFNDGIFEILLLGIKTMFTISLTAKKVKITDYCTFFLWSS